MIERRWLPVSDRQKLYSGGRRSSTSPGMCKKSRTTIYKVKKTDKTCKRAVVNERVCIGLCVWVWFRYVCVCVSVCVCFFVQSPWIQHMSLPWYRTVLTRSKVFLYISFSFFPLSPFFPPSFLFSLFFLLYHGLLLSGTWIDPSKSGLMKQKEKKLSRHFLLFYFLFFFFFSLRE